MIKEKGTAFGGALLITGTCIGAGMLAMPVVTGQAGFFPSFALNFICWIFMYLTGLLFLETALWMQDGSNLLSMADRFLGPGGKRLGGIAFIFLYGCLLVAYLSGGAFSLMAIVQSASNFNLSYSAVLIFLAFATGIIIFLGDRIIDKVNLILMMGLVLAFGLFMATAFGEIEKAKLGFANWPLAFLATPTLFSVYGYHNIIPSITNYLKRDIALLKKAVFWGTFLPFIIYTLWQLLVLGSIPPEVLEETRREGMSITFAFQKITGYKWLSLLGVYFSLFAILTSLIGVSFSVVDFLADGLSIERHSRKRGMLCFLALMPPALFALYNPNIFVTAMAYAGGFGEALLNGLFPVGMVWVAKYRLGLESHLSKKWSKPLLFSLALFTCAVALFEFYQEFFN